MDKKAPPAFEFIYKQFALPLTKFIYKRLGSKPDEAEEVFAKTMAAAWHGYNTFQNKSTYFTWLCRIALNKIADYYRDQVNRNSGLITPFLEDIANIEDKNISPEEKLALDELRLSVRNCLDALPSDKRQLLYLRYWKELSISEISKLTGISERAIEGKIYRAKKTLGEIISTKYPEISPSYQEKQDQYPRT